MWFWKWSIHDDGDAGKSGGDGDDYGDGDGKYGDQTKPGPLSSTPTLFITPPLKLPCNNNIKLES